jgi:hypothetical protein
MSPTNGHASDPANVSTNAVQQFATPASDTNSPTALTPNAAKIKELIAGLEIPFHPWVIEWRVTNTRKGGSPRGQVMPYADQRAYTDRLNALVTPAGWTRKYSIHTSGNFERSKDQRIVAKVLVMCELTIFGLGSHSATGESGPTMITLPRLRKRNLSNGLVPVLDWAAILIIILERGWIWMTASVRRRFPPYLTGRLLRAGDKACGHSKGGTHRTLIR